jgi:hypothetical protein
VFLTSGQSGLLVIMETPNGDNIAKFALMSGADGNVRSGTVRARPSNSSSAAATASAATAEAVDWGYGFAEKGHPVKLGTAWYDLKVNSQP